MKANNKLIARIITIVLMVPAFIMCFVPVFNAFVKSTNNTTIMENFKLFDSYADVDKLFVLTGEHQFNTVWMTLNTVFVVAIMILAVAYIVLLVLDLLKVSFKGKELVEKVLGYATLVCGILAFVTVILAIALNSFEGYVSTVTYGLAATFWAWFQIAFVVAGIIGILTAKPVKKAGKKK